MMERARSRPVQIVGGSILLWILLSFSRIDPLTTVVDGLQNASVYSLVALGIALIYRSTGVLNFAQGEFGTVAAWLVWSMLAGFNLEAQLSGDEVSFFKFVMVSLVAVLGAALLAVIVNRLIIQRLAQSSAITSLVATAGVALLLAQSQILIFEAQARKFPRPIDGSPRGLDFGPLCLASTNEGGVCAGKLAIGGIVVPWHTLIALIVLVFVALLLTIFFRTPAGIALLATAQEPFAAELHGVSVQAMSTLAWATAGLLAGVAGILGAGVFENISPALMTGTFLLPAFAGAVLGGLTSMAGAVVGGVALGVIVSFANAGVRAYDLSIPGPPEVATLAALLLVLTVRPQGLLGKEA